MGINVKVLFKNLAATLPGVDGGSKSPNEGEESGNPGFKLGEGGSQPAQKNTPLPASPKSCGCA